MKNSNLSESLASMSFSGIDGIALDAIISNDSTKIESAKVRLAQAREEFADKQETLTFASRRNFEAQIASAARLLA